MAALPHSYSFRDVAICVSLMTDSFRRSTSGEVMVCGGEGGQPGVDDTVDDLGWREGEHGLARCGRVRGYDGMTESFWANAFGGPAGSGLQGQYICAAQHAEAHLVAGRSRQFVQHRECAHHGLRIGADFGLGVFAGDHPQWQTDAIVALLGPFEETPRDEF